MKEIKLIKFEDRQDIYDLIGTREYVMLDKSKQWEREQWTLNNLENKDWYENNCLWFGLYEDDILDVVYYIRVWPELPVFSTSFVFTRKKDNRVKNESDFDQNLTETYNHAMNYMRDKGYTISYTARASYQQGWRSWTENKQSVANEFDVEIIETIPSGQQSKFSLIRVHVYNGPSNVEVHVVRSIRKVKNNDQVCEEHEE